MNARLATMNATSSVSQLSLGEFRTVTRQIGRSRTVSRNGTNRKTSKQTKATKAVGRQVTSIASNRHLSSSVVSTSSGKPIYVPRSEPKLSTNSGRVRHSPRPSVSCSDGVHVTVKLRSGIPSLRQKHVIEALERCFCKAKDRFEFELNAYTVMSNHIHLLVFVRSNEALRRGMQGLNIRLARAINRVFNRKGKVFVDRFHARVVRGFYAIKKALRYVVQNARKHRVAIPAGKWDRYSSGHYRNDHATESCDLPFLRTGGSFQVKCATLQLQPSEFPGPHNRAGAIC